MVKKDAYTLYTDLIENIVRTVFAMENDILHHCGVCVRSRPEANQFIAMNVKPVRRMLKDLNIGVYWQRCRA